MARRKSRRISSKKKRAGKNSVKLTRRIVIWAGAAVITILLLLIIGYYSLMAWLQSESFRETVEESLSDKTESNISITDPLQISDSTVSLNEITIRNKSLIKDARLGTVKAEFVFDELWDRCFHATNVSVKRLDVNLDNSDKPAYSSKGGGGSTFLQDLAPNQAVIDKIECEKANVNLLILRSDADKDPLKYSLSNSELTATPEGGDNWLFKIRKGKFTSIHPFLRQCSIDRATLHCAILPTQQTGAKEPEYLLTLSDCTVFDVKGGAERQAKPEGDGRASLSGYYHVSHNTSSRKWEVTFDAENTELSPLLDENWRKYLHGGKLQAKVKMGGVYKKITKVETLKPSAGARPQIVLKNAKFQALKFILSKQPDAIKKITDSLMIPQAASYLENKLNIIEIKEARCTLTYPYNESSAGIKDAWKASQIDVITKDKDLRLKGHLIIDSENKFRKSKLELGISKKMIEELADYSLSPATFVAIAQSALTYKDEYYWIPLPLEGSLISPAITSFNALTDAVKENVQQQFSTGVETLKDLGSSILGGQKEKTESGSGKNQSVTDQVIETTKDTAVKGINTIFNLIP